MEVNNRAMIDLGRILGYAENPQILSQSKHISGYASMKEKKAKPHKKITDKNWSEFISEVEEELGKEFCAVDAGAAQDWNEGEIRRVLRKLFEKGYLDRRVEHDPFTGSPYYLYWRKER